MTNEADFGRDYFATQETLAKLLAKENITVRLNANIDGLGLFNMKLRVLYVTRLAKDKEFLLPGIVGHEIGHALYSQIQEDEEKLFLNRFHHGVWNAIEDGYVDRRTMKDFPGLKHHRFNVFNFSFGQWDPEKDQHLSVRILNTITYNCKGILFGLSQKFPECVSPEDVALFSSCSTYFDESLANRVKFAKNVMDRILSYDTAKNEKTKQPEPENSNAPGNTAPDGKNLQPSDEEDAIELPNIDKNEEPQDEDDTTENDDENENDEGVEEQDEHDDDQFPPDITDDLEDILDNLPEKETPNSDNEPEDNEPMDENVDDLLDDVITDKDLIEAIGNEKTDDEGTFFDEYNRKIVVGTTSFNFPDFNNIESLSSINDILDPLKYDKENLLHNGFPKVFLQSPVYATWMSAFAKNMASARAQAQKMFQHFNLRTNAMNLAMRQYQKTGMLDPTRSALYKIYDDVFQRRTIDCHQQNHAYVIMLDWSGSMQGTIMPLVHRIMELVTFAQLANVEVEVWLYTDGGDTSNLSSLSNKNCTTYSFEYGKSNALNETQQDLYDKNLGLIYKSARFIKVVNTKHHSTFAVNSRIQALYVYACGDKRRVFSSASIRSVAYSMKIDPRRVDAIDERAANFYTNTMSQSGTSIYESIVFGGKRLLEMNAQIKNLIIMTDGADCGFSSVVSKYEKFEEGDSPESMGALTSRHFNGHISYFTFDNLKNYAFGNFDVTEKFNHLVTEHMKSIGRNRFHQTDNEHPKYELASMRLSISNIASSILKAKGINVFGFGWNLSNVYLIPLAYQVDGTPINITFRSSKGKTRNFGHTEYTLIDNKFITQIGNALLGEKVQELREHKVAA